MPPGRGRKKIAFERADRLQKLPPYLFVEIDRKKAGKVLVERVDALAQKHTATTVFLFATRRPDRVERIRIHTAAFSARALARRPAKGSETRSASPGAARTGPVGKDRIHRRGDR